MVEQDIERRAEDARIHGNTDLWQILQLALDKVIAMQEADRWGDCDANF